MLTLPRLLLIIVLLPAAMPVMALDVFVSVLPLAYLAEAVGGDRIRVEPLVGQGQNPHGYEPGPRQMARLADAEILVRAGLPYEAGWLARMDGAASHLRILDARDGLDLLPADPAGNHSGEPGHENDLDQHIWTSPANARVIAAHLRDALSELDPEGAAAYTANFDRLAGDLERLDTEIRALLQGLSGRSFLVLHPAWGYFARDYGLHQVAIEHEGKEPGPKSLARITDLARSEGVRVILVQPQLGSRTAAALAAAIGARVEVADPLARDYPRSLRQLAHTLKEALR